MVDIDKLRILIMEDQYPVFTDDQLEGMAEMYDNIYQLAYVCCLSKASAEKITIGPISIENDLKTKRRLSTAIIWLTDSAVSRPA